MIFVLLKFAEQLLESNLGTLLLIGITRLMVCIGRAMVEYSVGRDFMKQGKHHEVRRTRRVIVLRDVQSRIMM